MTPASHVLFCLVWKGGLFPRPAVLVAAVPVADGTVPAHVSVVLVLRFQILSLVDGGLGGNDVCFKQLWVSKIGIQNYMKLSLGIFGGSLSSCILSINMDPKGFNLKSFTKRKFAREDVSAPSLVLVFDGKFRGGLFWRSWGLIKWTFTTSEFLNTWKPAMSFIGVGNKTDTSCHVFFSQKKAANGHSDSWLNGFFPSKKAVESFWVFVHQNVHETTHVHSVLIEQINTYWNFYMNTQTCPILHATWFFQTLVLPHIHLFHFQRGSWFVVFIQLKGILRCQKVCLVKFKRVHRKPCVETVPCTFQLRVSFFRLVGGECWCFVRAYPGAVTDWDMPSIRLNR